MIGRVFNFIILVFGSEATDHESSQLFILNLYLEGTWVFVITVHVLTIILFLLPIFEDSYTCISASAKD